MTNAAARNEGRVRLLQWSGKNKKIYSDYCEKSLDFYAEQCRITTSQHKQKKRRNKMETKYYIDNNEVTQSEFQKAVDASILGLDQVVDVSNENGYNHRFFYN